MFSVYVNQFTEFKNASFRSVELFNFDGEELKRLRADLRRESNALVKTALRLIEPARGGILFDASGHQQ